MCQSFFKVLGTYTVTNKTDIVLNLTELNSGGDN